MTFLKQLLATLLVATFSIISNADSNKTLQNALYQHDSAYLAMHGLDPVNWLVWNANTLAKAKAENKIIMVSSGYFSCHWCHVMHNENYLDNRTANYLNQHFISVKIDRELTPEGYPFYAFTYQPKPDFFLSLEKIQIFWQRAADKITATAIAAAIPPAPIKNNDSKLTAKEFTEQMLQQLYPQMDMLSGGLTRGQGGANKFPNAPILKTLLSLNTLSEEQQDWLTTTLDQMQTEHLIDHVHGGFYRYTIDPEWQIPHFEKMLYTQAQLAEIFFMAGKMFNRKDYKKTATETLNYVQKRLYQANSGLYLSSQSAVDKNQIEAADYVWTEAELKATLNPKEFAQVSKEWQLDQPTPYEIPAKGKNRQGWSPKPTEKYWASIKNKLENSTIKPANQIPTDTKSILGWNGLLLSAFAKGVTPDNTNRQEGQQLANSLIKHLSTKQPARAISNQNVKMGTANIQDYAYIIQGLKDWQTTLPEKQAKTLSQQISKLEQTAKEKSLNPQGWLYSEAPLLPGQTGSWAIADDPIPSPTAILENNPHNNLQKTEAQTALAKNPLSFASYATTLNNNQLIPIELEEYTP